MPTVLVTRPRGHEGDEFYSTLQEAGIDVVTIPMISHSFPDDLTDLDRALNNAANGAFDYLIFSSPTAVRFFEERSGALNLIPALREHVRAGAIGDRTAAILREIGIPISLEVPAEAGSEEFASLLSQIDIAEKRILLLQSDIGLDTLEMALKRLGASPKRVTLYRTKGPSESDKNQFFELITKSPPDAIAFFSPSAVRECTRLFSQRNQSQYPLLAALGKTTAAAIEESFQKLPDIIKAEGQGFADAIVRSLRLNKRH